MGKLYKTFGQGWADLFRGAGFVPPPRPDNTANAPATPPVQWGSYQYIIPQMFDGGGSSITDVPVIPPFGVDWAQMPLNTYGLSGLEGGGSTGQVPNVNNGATLFYDSDSNSYVDLSLLGGR